MIQCILTGSQAYGKPGKKSDIDVVMLLTKEELALFSAKAGECEDYVNLASGEEAALRFGNLNVIAVTDPVVFGIWQKGTAALRLKKPVTRTYAMNTLDKLRQVHGITPPEEEDAEEDDVEDEDEVEDGPEPDPEWGLGEYVKFKTGRTHDGKPLKGTVTIHGWISGFRNHPIVVDVNTASGNRYTGVHTSNLAPTTKSRALKIEDEE